MSDTKSSSPNNKRKREVFEASSNDDDDDDTPEVITTDDEKTELPKRKPIKRRRPGMGKWARRRSTAIGKKRYEEYMDTYPDIVGKLICKYNFRGMYEGKNSIYEDPDVLHRSKDRECYVVSAVIDYETRMKHKIEVENQTTFPVLIVEKLPRTITDYKIEGIKNGIACVKYTESITFDGKVPEPTFEHHMHVHDIRYPYTKGGRGLPVLLGHDPDLIKPIKIEEYRKGYICPTSYMVVSKAAKECLEKYYWDSPKEYTRLCGILNGFSRDEEIYTLDDIRKIEIYTGCRNRKSLKYVILQKDKIDDFDAYLEKMKNSDVRVFLAHSPSYVVLCGIERRFVSSERVFPPMPYKGTKISLPFLA